MFNPINTLGRAWDSAVGGNATKPASAPNPAIKPASGAFRDATPPTPGNGGVTPTTATPAPGYGALSTMWRKSATAPARGPEAGVLAGIASGVKAAAPANNPPAYGTGSGPTAIEDRYNQRANGTDPGWEYATGRATDSINKQYAARGGYNSSGATNSISDMFANATSQREGQLDTLANEATGAHQNQLNSMFTEGLGIANGASGAGQAYGMGSGGAQSTALSTQEDLQLAKMGIDQKTKQAMLNAGIDLTKFLTGIAGQAGGGGA